ncbi:MAG: phage tail tape measure protein [Ferrimicrobium sp.]
MAVRTVSLRFSAITEEAKSAMNHLASDAEKSGSKISEGFKHAGSSLTGWLGNLGIFGPFQGALDKIGESIDSSIGGFSKGGEFFKAYGEMGKAALEGIGGAALGIGAEGLKLGVQYQKQEAILAGHADITMKAAAAIGNAFLSTGSDVMATGQQMMSAYAPLAGEFGLMEGHALSAAQATRVMSAADVLATATGEGLAGTAKVLADTMLVFHLKTNKAAEAANVLFNASRLLGIPITTLGQNFQRMEPMVSQAHLTVGQFAGLMITVARNAGSGNQAVRLVGRGVMALENPSAKATQALAGMGISLFNAQGKFVGMYKAISLIHAAMARLPGGTQAIAAAQALLANETTIANDKLRQQTPALKLEESHLAALDGVLKLHAAALTKSTVAQDLLGSQGGPFMDIILGGTGAIKSNTAMTEKSGVAQKANREIMATLAGEMEFVKKTLENLATKIGMVLVPILQKLINKTIQAVDWFEKHKAVARDLAIVIGVVLGGAIAKYVGGVGKAVVTTAIHWASMVGKALWWVAQNVAAMGSWVLTTATSVGETIALWSMYAAEWIASTAGAAASFVATHAAMAAGFIAENLAMAASATAAFIAENAATLGIVAGIALLVGGVIYMATHWKQVWSDIKQWTGDAWNFIDGIFHDIGHWFDEIKPIIAVFAAPWVLQFTLIKDAIGLLEAPLKGVLHLASDVGGFLGKIFGGSSGGAKIVPVRMRATGGDVAAQMPYIVGERGPELFVPSVGGTILPDVHPGTLGTRAPTGASTGAATSPVILHYAPVIQVPATLGTQVTKQIQDLLTTHDEEVMAMLQSHVA